MKYKQSTTRKAMPKRSALVVALAVGMGISGLAFGQATSGAIFGQAPVGDTVVATSATGLTRTVQVSSNGSYTLGTLPAGEYTVVLKNANGATVSTRNNVQIRVGGGVQVTFGAGSTAQNAQELSTVTVSANALPTIDVTTVHDSSIITAQQLRQLPVAHNAAAIALLTPGTMASSAFNGINFGGSSVAENAHYVNGYNTGSPYNNVTAYYLPFGAIATQQTLANGFGAKYGRSDGGVISQIGKRGTNEWHFGAQIRWEPRALQASPASTYRPYQILPSSMFCKSPSPSGSPTCAPVVPGVPSTEPYTHAPNYKPGKLYSDNSQDGQWSTTYTAYIGGPLVKDKLFIFLDAAVSNNSGSARGTIDAGTKTFYSGHSSDYYGKIDWNVTESNILEFTYLGHQAKSGIGTVYNYDHALGTATSFRNVTSQPVNDTKFYVLHYTSYLSDNATLSILYGRGKSKTPTIYTVPKDIPPIGSICNQNPAYWNIPASDTDPNDDCAQYALKNNQGAYTRSLPNQSASSHGLRVDFTYQLGNHKLGVGIDNMYYTASAQGASMNGPDAPSYVQAAAAANGWAPPTGTAWIYNGPQYVQYYNFDSAAGMSTKQTAFYLQDTWQITPNLLAVIGLRDDNYTNYNNEGVAFLSQRSQWSPRIGLSWDVFGDSSLKIYGNVGRYFLALPQAAATRSANKSIYYYAYYHYTGINPDGSPIITPADAASPIIPLTTPDGEVGNGKNPKTVAAANLSPMYADQINLGFDAKLNQDWTYGASVHYRTLEATIDDECEQPKVNAKMASMGYTPSDYMQLPSCRLINPGKTSIILMQEKADPSQYVRVPMTFADWGYPKKPTRNVASVDLYMQKSLSSHWYGRVDYTYTSAFGNTAGALKPNIQQLSVNKTEDWDAASLMVGSYGQLLTARRHVLRIRGGYVINPQWQVTLNAIIQSGAPEGCLGWYGPNAINNPAGYNRPNATGSYHWCDGRIVHPGSSDPLAGHTPWTHQYNVAVIYRPAFADHKLRFKLQIYNLLNEQNTLQTGSSYTLNIHQISNFFHYPVARESPRAVQFIVDYRY